MGRSTRNTYAKALKHLKSSHEDVTYNMLGEDAPTNSTSGLYRLEPDEVIIDPNGADPVDFGEDPAAWEARMQELLGDYVPYDGTDTSGLFEDDGRIRTVEPPGDTSYVLGPMSAMYYGWGGFTQIGYIRQSDRRMVNLARIDTTLGAWDGVSDFTSYGQLTLEQAVWFRDITKRDGANNDTPNYRAFYPGPPSNPADEYGRYLAVIVGESKPPAKTVRTGDHGSAQDAGFPWFNVPDSQLTPEQRRRRRQFDAMRSGITDMDSFMDAWARRWGGTEGPNAPNAPAEGKWWMSMMRLMDAGMSYDAASQALGLDNFLDKNFPDAGKTTRRGQGGRELGDTTRRGGEYDRLVNTPDSQLTPAERETKVNLSLAQLGARALRSLTDSATYAGDYVFKGLANGVEYLPSFSGASNLKILGINVPKIADIPGALARAVTGGKSNIVSRGLDGAIQFVLGKNYATQYFTPDLDTAIKYAGEGGSVVAIPRPQGMRGWKNWFGSNVSRGFDPSKGVEQLVSTADSIAADAAGLTQKGLVNNADDLARLQQLASKGSKASTLLGKLGRAVPFVGAAAAIADVSTRSAKGDYVGAVLGGISAIPGPVGWVGLGAQIISDATGATDPDGFVNQTWKSWGQTLGSKQGSIRGRSGASRASVREGYLLTEEEQMQEANAMREALFESGLPRDIKEFAREQTIYLMSIGVNPGLVSIIVRTIVGENLTDKEKKYIKDEFPTLIAIMVGGAEAMAKNVVRKNKKPVTTNESKIARAISNVKKPVTIKEVKQERVKRRPRVIGSDSNSKTINSGLMKQAEVPASFKKPEDRMWGKYERRQNARASQERKNVVLDHLGGSDHAWQYILERNASKRNVAGYFDKDGTPHTITRKEQVNSETLLFIADENGKKESILQSDLNDKLDKEFNQELFAAYFSEQETMQADNDPLFKRVSKSLKKKIDYPDKPAKKGYPDKEPPETINGYHPDLVDGKTASNSYNRLDPISANSMPPTGNKKIDAKVRKARKMKSE